VTHADVSASYFEEAGSCLLAAARSNVRELRRAQ
jgi:hypothetical protein